MDVKTAILTGIILVIVIFAIIFNIADVQFNELTTKIFEGMKNTVDRSLNTLP